MSGGCLYHLHPEDVLGHGDQDPLGTNLTSDVGNQVIGVKVEEVEDDLGQIGSAVIKAEPVVSLCVCPLLRRYPQLALSVCPH
jgi:hypothetical protein